MGRAALRRRLRVCGRRPARALSEGRDLALHAVLRQQAAPLGVAVPAPVLARLAGHPGDRADHARDAAPDDLPAVSDADLLHQPRRVLALPGGSPGGGAGRRHPDQDLEHGADRAPARRAGTAADGGARRGARESDQPALPVQHADVDHVADPIAAGNGARADRQAFGPAPASAPQSGALRDAPRGAGRG